ncbi:unnamed protein product [marine sediment metagenome]|uniref:Uncharacterized protein n=1 Tax=marine sediment metagenome TaxID=412755 RepID=X1GK80_9ZZZZ
MKKIIETKLSDDITVWGYGDVTHSPELFKISLDERDGWFIGQKVKVTIESIEKVKK